MFIPKLGILTMKENNTEFPTLGTVNLDKLPPLNVKPTLKFGRWSEAAKLPIIKNFSHVIHWMFVNFMTKSEIQALVNGRIEEEHGQGLASEKVSVMERRAAEIKSADKQQINDIPLNIQQALTMQGLYKEVEQLRRVVCGLPAEE